MLQLRPPFDDLHALVPLASSGGMAGLSHNVDACTSRRATYWSQPDRNDASAARGAPSTGMSCWDASGRCRAGALPASMNCTGCVGWLRASRSRALHVRQQEMPALVRGHATREADGQEGCRGSAGRFCAAHQLVGLRRPRATAARPDTRASATMTRRCRQCARHSSPSGIWSTRFHISGSSAQRLSDRGNWSNRRRISGATIVEWCTVVVTIANGDSSTGTSGLALLPCARRPRRAAC